MFNRTYPVRERMAEATVGGSVYLRSQPCPSEKERPVRDGARARNGKRVLLSCIGIWRQVCMAAAHR